jgi:aerobic carbon-monoxide dehydrogenase medium subunit
MYEFGYNRPQTLADALAALGADDAALALSGGQTLLPVLRARLAAPSQLVDLARLPELKGIRNEGGRLIVGAAETHADVAVSPIVQAAVPALARLAGGIGDVQVRYRGTIGGSVANNDPAACYPSALLALEADVITNRRSLPAAQFFTGMFATALEPGEIVTAIAFPHCSEAHYEKFKNPASRFALIGVFAARLNGAVRIAITGGGTGVFRWNAVEAHVQGGGAISTLDSVPLDLDLFTGDIHGSAEYRKQLAYVVTRRTLAAIN